MTTTHVLVPLAPGFEEIEAVTIVDVLRRAGAAVTVAGTEAGPIRGSRGIVLVPDATLDDIDAQRFDAIVLPGGAEGAARLARDRRVLDALRAAAEAGRLTAAICAAPTVLAAAGLASGRALTAHPSVQDELDRAGARIDRAARVVADGKLLTSQGPGTAMEFAFALVEVLFGAAKVAELNRGILARVG